MQSGCELNKPTSQALQNHQTLIRVGRWVGEGVRFSVLDDTTNVIKRFTQARITIAGKLVFTVFPE